MNTTPAGERQRLLKANTEKIEYLYEQSIKEGIDRPVILLLDIRDQAAKEMATELAGKASVDEHIELARKKSVDYSLLYPLSLEQAIRAVSKWPSKRKTILSQPLPDGLFYVIVIGCCGISWATHKNP